MLQYIDIHTHQNERAEILAVRNLEVGRENVWISKSLFSAGIHPWYIEDVSKQFKDLEELVKEENCLAIGECGLDKSVDVDFELQKEVFLKQVLLAEKVNKPLVIHCVRSFNEILQIRKNVNSKMPWIFHGFSKGIQLAEQILSVGCYISLNELYVKLSKSDELINRIDLTKLFLETDDTNSDIEKVYQLFCDKRNVSKQFLQEQIQENFNKVFL